MRGLVGEEASGAHARLQRGPALGRLEKAPQMATADSFLKLMLWKCIVFCHLQKLKVDYLLESCVCAVCCWMLTP